MLYFPKIYLRNNIYYVSRDINKLHDNYISLKEENRFLAQQLEDMKFKNQIIDSLLFNNHLQFSLSPSIDPACAVSSPINGRFAINLSTIL